MMKLWNRPLAEANVLLKFQNLDLMLNLDV